tara:strand:+ start:29 stop:163 length:135 start_codon:yes stop_codon:yes gene_type:complete
MKKLLAIMVLGLLLSSCTVIDAVNIGAAVFGGIEKDPKPKKDKK